jgi:2-C-methyl-D-erythritol 4-phosphate cytidylyltransferase/2-C-methyl-D-erythritol 2,4-cyclodiphosphate synthase
VSGGQEPGDAASETILGVVVAAGTSSRMGGQDKLQAIIGGKSVLRRSVEALAEGGASRIVIVTAADGVARVSAEAWLPACVRAVVAGGARRQESVAAGIAAAVATLGVRDDERENAPESTSESAPDGAIVLVHDAARPLVSPALVRAVADATKEYGAAIPVLPVAETLKRLLGDRVGETVNRTDVVTAQTPQGVKLGLIRQAYRTFPPEGAQTWTDEASLLEACRIPVHAIPGEPTNLKVTVPADLERARVMLDAGLAPGSAAARSEAIAIERSADPTSVAQRTAVDPLAAGRVGLGVDSHSFGSGSPLSLGGIRIDGAPRLEGHSDGDAALHAVADALLGAAGLGDLGRLFPADHRTPRGIASAELLSSVAGRVRAEGWRVAGVDLTITAARPKLAALLPEMEAAIAAAIGIDAATVNVKASTGNLAGDEGAGRSISATAVAWLVPQQSMPGEA